MQDLLKSGGPLQLKKCRRGYMLYSMNDATIGRLLDLYGEFSEGEVELFRKLLKPGDTVVEVGANIGALTVPLSEIVGPQGNVVAFEPQRILFQNLCANVALNGLTNVRTVNTAVGKQSGSVTLPKIDYAKPGVFGGHAIGDADDGENVQIVTLDQFLRMNRCRLMKIDVEGMEEDVILGATETIRKFQPYLYVENDREDRSPGLIETLLKLDYRLYWHLPPLARDDNFFGHAKDFLPRTISINMICFPSNITVQGMDDMRVTGPQDWWKRFATQP